MNRIRSARAIRFISATLCFLLVVGIASTAAADETESSALPGLSSALLDEAINSPNAQTLESFTQTDPQAARQLPHDELDRSEALTLLTSVFGDQIEGLAGIFDEMDVERFISDNAAVMPAGSLEPTATMIGEEPSPAQSAEPVLVESSLPLRTEDAAGQEAPVDLGLEHSEGELQPANPLVTTGIPTELGEGISLANAEIKLEFPEAFDFRTPSIVEHDAAFYPNVQADTDLLVTPTASGVETLTQLRTPEAPRTETVQVDLPEGAILKETAAGGAEATQNGRALLSVAPPSALDANGNEVPVSLSVAGHSVELEVSPTESNVFPILVDPLWQAEIWNWTWGNSSLATWTPRSKTPSYQALPYSYWDPGHLKGLDLTSGFQGWAHPNDSAEWNYYVPRFESDMAKYGQRPQSFLNSAQIEGVEFLLQGNHATYPLMIAGLIDTEHGGWVSVGSHSGYDGEISGWSGKYWFPNYENTDAKMFDFALATLETEGQAKYRNAFAAQAIVGIADHNAPKINKLTGPSTWMNNVETSHIGYSVTDPGIGVYEMTVDKPTAWPGYGHPTRYKMGCTGIPANPCPRTVDSDESGRPILAIEPKYLVQGIGWIKVQATDPLGTTDGIPNSGYTCCGEPYPHTVNSEVKVKIDHTAPTLSLSGSVTEQTSLGTTRLQYTLKYNAADGSEELPTLYSTFGTEGGGNGQLKHPADVSVDPDGNIWVADQNNNRIEKFNEKNEYAAAYGTLGSGNGQLSHPTGLEADSKGNIWVTDAGNNRIEKFNKKGEYLDKFGSLGSDSGQFSAPQGIAIDSKGNVWVVDTGNNRIEKFSEKGTFLSSIGSKGSDPGQFNEPAAIDTDPSGNVWVVDTGNNRIEKFSEKGEYLAAYGTLGSGNAQFNHPNAIEVDTKGNVWVADQNNGRVEQFSERGEYLGKFGSQGIGPGQFSFSNPIGIATNSIGELWVTDPNNNRIENWLAPKGTQSGVRSVAIKVDGKVVDSPAQSCAVGGCPMAGEWTLQSSEYSPGTHTVEAVATDGVELAIAQKQTVEIQRDTTKPTIQTSGALVNAPSGWVQQKSYGLDVSAADVGGYGVTSLAFRIDGAEAASTSKACPTGGCSVSISKSIDMTEYAGGAHEAEIVATDGAGNTSNKRWTINVDPEGHVSTEEATATLEAVDVTGPVNTVGESEEEEELEGTAPGIEIEQTGDVMIATGTATPTVIETTPGGSFTVEIPEAHEFESCEFGESPGELQGEEPEEFGSPGSAELCTESQSEEEAEGDESMVPIQVTPIGTKEGATTPVIADTNAAVSGNTASQVDTVLRPLYDGGMTFQSIRDETAPEEYSWRVDLGDDQVLRLIDDQHATVYYNDRTPAFGITAEPAHDAIGTTVPTSLSVSGGDVVTLAVHFKAGNQGNPFVYPVIAGTGWEGGFRTIHVDMDNKSEEEEEGEEGISTFSNDAVQIATYGPPVAEGHPYAMTQLGNFNEAVKRKFKFTYCKPHEIPNTNGVTPPVTGWGTRRPGQNLPKVVSDCSNPDLEGIYWTVSAHGWFHYVIHHWVWVTDFGPEWCDKRGEEQGIITKAHCKLIRNEPGHGSANAVHGPIEIVGQYRFSPLGGQWGFAGLRAVCFTEGGLLYPRYTRLVSEPVERPMIWEYNTVHVSQNCGWP